MDVLKDRQTRAYDYISRYVTFPFYYNTLDNKYIYGITKLLDENTPYVSHQVAQSDTLDILAFKYYGRPDYYWIIGYFNNIQDPFIELKSKFKVIKVPSLSQVQFK